MKSFFYVTMNYMPKYENKILTKVHDDIFRNIETGELYRKRLLYSFGWGTEPGYELLPALSFKKLIELIEQPQPVIKRRFLRGYTEEQIELCRVWNNNIYGAVAVIMQDYLEEFIDFLEMKADTDYFSDNSICENFKCFSFDVQKTKREKRWVGYFLTRSYEDMLNDYPKWRKISSKIISQIYK